MWIPDLNFSIDTSKSSSRTAPADVPPPVPEDISWLRSLGRGKGGGEYDVSAGDEGEEENVTPQLHDDEIKLANNYAHCTKFRLEIGMVEFLRLFWENESQAQHVQFLEVCNHETNVEITPWNQIDSELAGVISMQRTVSCHHPLPVLNWVPYLPAYVKNTCFQTISFDSKEPNRLKIVELSIVRAIPFVKPRIGAIWDVVDNDGVLEIKTDLSFSVCNVSFVQQLIEFHAKQGMTAFFKDWSAHASALILSRRQKGVSGIQADERQGVLISKFFPSA